MKNIFFLFFLTFTMGFSQNVAPKIITGKVTDGRTAMENVTVSIVDGETATTTNSEGQYSIEAEIGDKIQFSYIGMKTINIKVEDVTRILNPVMVPDVTELDEVTVSKRKKKSVQELELEFNSNPNLIRSAYGILDPTTSAYQIRMLSKNQITEVGLCILNLLRNRFSGVTVYGNCIDGGSVIVRGANSLNYNRGAIFDVDGLILNDPPIWIPVGNIQRVAILSGFAGTNPYGGIASGGVVIINTNASNAIAKTKELKDKAKLRNNYADGKELSRAEVAQNAPTYLKEFMKSDSFEASKGIFEKYQKTYSNSPYFLMDAYRHFVETYDEVDYADNIIDNHFGIYGNNPVLMKALAYIYESQERFDKANEVYKEVFILRPNYSQSYMDMANSYRNINEPTQAAAIHARYEYLIDEGFLAQDTIGFEPIMSREYNNLLMLEKNTVFNAGKAKDLFIAEEDFKGTRLVFEWNDGEAEFDLQFVNPENQYYKWKHSIFDNAETIEREKDFGYNVTEYLVDGSLPGTWQVNVNYLGNKSLTPTYLKVTIYHNYGSKAQYKEVKVFKLGLKNVNQELFMLQARGKFAVE